MLTNFLISKNNPRVTYSPDISGKIIVKEDFAILTVPEYCVKYGTVDRLTGLTTFVGSTVQTYATLEEAKKGLVSFSGFGRPKEPFQGVRGDPRFNRKKGLASFNKPKPKYDGRFSVNESELLGNIGSLEQKLRNKWKV